MKSSLRHYKAYAILMPAKYEVIHIDQNLFKNAREDIDIEGWTLAQCTLERALKLALSKEKESIRLYTSAQEKVLNPGSVGFLKELVEEEKKHRSKILEAIRDVEKAKEIGSFETKITDLRIVDYLEDVSLSPEADYQQILIYAGKREKATHDFYMELARRYKGEEIGKMFAKLAQEELKHKYRLEREYDDVILKYM